MVLLATLLGKDRWMCQWCHAQNHWDEWDNHEFLTTDQRRTNAGRKTFLRSSQDRCGNQKNAKGEIRARSISQEQPEASSSSEDQPGPASRRMPFDVKKYQEMSFDIERSEVDECQPSRAESSRAEPRRHEGSRAESS